jgi:crotonobetainyl-CoA:carnitine CoA-transferase CaiB-like acyl-CoA transferase
LLLKTDKKILSTLNLKAERGKQLLVELIQKSAWILENFKPGVKAKLGFPWNGSTKSTPGVYVQISGYGQTGPYRNAPATTASGVGMGGITYLTGFPIATGEAGRRARRLSGGYSAALGVLMALYHRDVVGSGVGQQLDISLYDTVFRVLEYTAVSYIRWWSETRRAAIGNASTIAPRFTFAPGRHMGLRLGRERPPVRAFLPLRRREDFLSRAEFSTPPLLRIANREELDEACGGWIAGIAGRSASRAGRRNSIGPSTASRES